MPITKVMEEIVRLVEGAATVDVMNVKEDLAGRGLRVEKDRIDKRMLLEVEMPNAHLVMACQKVGDMIHVSDSMTSPCLN